MYNEDVKGSILIYGGTIKDRETKASEILKDVEEINTLYISIPEGKKSIGIEQIREAITFLQKKPIISDNKAVVILNGEKMTLDAQNALLKILEEPPVYATIILTTKTQETLLPTVISRCRKISVKAAITGKKRSNEESGVGERNLEKVKKMSVDAKFSWAQETAKKEKEDIIELLEEWITEERELMLKESRDQNLHAENIQIIQEVKKDLEKINLNTRLALDYLVVSLKHT